MKLILAEEGNMDQIRTVSDMFVALQKEIEDAKNGVLQLDTARVVLKGRQLQLKAAEINLQFARLNRVTKKEGELNLLTGKKEE